MRISLLVLGFCGLVGSLSAAPLANVPFTVTDRQFAAGDQIVVDEVLASSSKLSVGDQVVIRGHYRLASAAAAHLGLMVTHRTHVSGLDSTETSQWTTIAEPSGTFTLSCHLAYDGTLHVGFYPEKGGASFGGVYIAPATDAR